jgi:hypothetical protein
MAMDLDQIEMRQTIDQTRRGDLANPPEIIGINLVDIATGELFSAGRDAVEHLIGPIEIVNGAEDEIEPVPIFLYPRAPGGGRFRIVVQLEAGANFNV